MDYFVEGITYQATRSCTCYASATYCVPQCNIYRKNS